MQDRIGALVTGFEADIIAPPSDPRRDIRLARRVGFVMNGGMVARAP